jgi:hypothetical protein
VNNSLVPRVGHMRISGLKGRLIEKAGAFAGLNNSYISNVVLENINLEAPAGSWSCSNADGTSSNVKPEPCAALRG